MRQGGQAMAGAGADDRPGTRTRVRARVTTCAGTGLKAGRGLGWVQGWN